MFTFFIYTVNRLENLADLKISQKNRTEKASSSTFQELPFSNKARHD